MKRKSVFYISAAGMVAALYAVLTLLSSAFGLSSGVIQIRLSEMLCVLPFFLPAAVPGLALGCAAANIITGAMPLDVLFGSIATLIGAVATHLLGKAMRNTQSPLIPLPNVLANTLIIPQILKFVYGFEGSVIYFTLTVGLGEIISSFCFGIPLFLILRKNKLFSEIAKTYAERK